MEDAEKPGPKARPALVKRASADQHGNPWVHVAYGTTKEVSKLGVENFIVSNMAEMDTCGLWCATRFRLDRVAILPWADEFFADAPNRTSPFMGRLSEHATRLLGFQGAMLARQEEAKQGNLDI